MQYILATGAGVPTDVAYDSHGFDLVGWATFVVSNDTAPLVWSMSYGEGINGGIKGRQPVDYVHRFDQEVQKMGVLGISVMISSGDSGVYDRIPFEVVEFHPSFPACCPSVRSACCVGRRPPPSTSARGLW